MMHDDRDDRFWYDFSVLCECLSSYHAKDLIYQLVKREPELANDLYFELENLFLKKDESGEKIRATITIEDAADGSGDGILTFPPEFIEETGWKEGDTIKMTPTDDGKLILKKI